MAKILITGAAGFIGYHLSQKLVENPNYIVVGIDNLNQYYDVNLKLSRLRNLGIDIQQNLNPEQNDSSIFNNFSFIKMDLTDSKILLELMTEMKFDYVVNLAAQAGVRYSLENPESYLNSNITGFLNILEGCRHNKVKHLIYASTSSVYGLNSNMPLKETHNTDHPISLYAATKKSNELFAHSYSHLFNIPTTGLRFFTVYGPWGRPDMALFKFTKAIFEKKPIDIYNNGEMIRDFTFVSDIVESISRLIKRPAVSDESWDSKSPKSCSSSAPYQIFNIGNSSPIKLMDYITALENKIGITAEKQLLPMQPGDVPSTHADTNSLNDYISFRPKTLINDGINLFVDWYKKYYLIN